MKPLRNHCGFRFVALAAACATGIALGSARADDELDRQLLESLERGHERESPGGIVERLLENTQTAHDRLTRGRWDDETTAVQQKILDDLDALLKQTSPPPPSSSEFPPPAAAGSPRQPIGDDESAPASTQAGRRSTADSPHGQDSGGSPDPDAASRESAERTAHGDEPPEKQVRRLDLATSAWGHLPPKEREQMRSAFSETYLPQYDDLVRRYYEALASRREKREPPAN